MELIETFIITFAIVYFGTKILKSMLHSWAENKIAEIDAVKDSLSKLIHTVKPEQHGEVTYWFDADSDAFLGQGTTADEIIAHVKSRFPTHLFLLPNDDVISAKTQWQPKRYSDIDQVKNLLKNDDTSIAR